MAYTDKYSGERYTQKQIEKHLHNSKAELLSLQRENYGWNFCVECSELAQQGVRIPDDLEHKTITCAHIKSVKKCKDDSEIERIWDVKNMIPECLYHHAIRDKNNIKR